MDNGLEEIKREFMEMTDDEIIKEAERIEKKWKMRRRYEIARALYIGYVACSIVATLVLFMVGYAIHNFDLEMWGMLVLATTILLTFGLMLDAR